MTDCGTPRPSCAFAEERLALGPDAELDQFVSTLGARGLQGCTIVVEVSFQRVPIAASLIRGAAHLVAGLRATGVEPVMGLQANHTPPGERILARIQGLLERHSVTEAGLEARIA
jgi:hypothetical protein